VCLCGLKKTRNLLAVAVIKLLYLKEREIQLSNQI
jgi:hypothetical protein